MKLINFPERIVESDYDALVNKIANQMSKDQNVVSLYQMGSVKNPGISDLDIICVFKDGSSNFENFRNTLNTKEKKILTHGLFGVYESDFKEACRSNYISNLKLIYGKEFELSKFEPIPQEYKTQIALEYLLKLHITIQAQSKFGVFKLRSFLLLAKAVIFDLELMGIESGELYNSVKKVIYIRDTWFENQPSKENLIKLINEFKINLKDFLDQQLSLNKLYLSQSNFILPGKIKLEQASNFQLKSSGIFLPRFLSFLGDFYIKLQFRLVNLTFYVPYHLINNDVIMEKYKFAKSLSNTNSKNFPYFVSLNSSLTTV